MDVAERKEYRPPSSRTPRQRPPKQERSSLHQKYAASQKRPTSRGQVHAKSARQRPLSAAARYLGANSTQESRSSADTLSVLDSLNAVARPQATSLASQDKSTSLSNRSTGQEGLQYTHKRSTVYATLQTRPKSALTAIYASKSRRPSSAKYVNRASELTSTSPDSSLPNQQASTFDAHSRSNHDANLSNTHRYRRPRPQTARARLQQRQRTASSNLSETPNTDSITLGDQSKLQQNKSQNLPNDTLSLEEYALSPKHVQKYKLMRPASSKKAQKQLEQIEVNSKSNYDAGHQQGLSVHERYKRPARPRPQSAPIARVHSVDKHHATLRENGNQQHLSKIPENSKHSSHPRPLSASMRARYMKSGESNDSRKQHLNSSHLKSEQSSTTNQKVVQDFLRDYTYEPVDSPMESEQKEDGVCESAEQLSAGTAAHVSHYNDEHLPGSVIDLDDAEIFEIGDFETSVMQVVSQQPQQSPRDIQRYLGVLESQAAHTPEKATSTDLDESMPSIFSLINMREDKAVIIQKCFRGHLSRLSLLETVMGAGYREHCINSRRIAITAAKQHQSSTLIQCVWRAHLARLMFRRVSKGKKQLICDSVSEDLSADKLQTEDCTVAECASPKQLPNHDGQSKILNEDSWIVPEQQHSDSNVLKHGSCVHAIDDSQQSTLGCSLAPEQPESDAETVQDGSRQESPQTSDQKYQSPKPFQGNNTDNALLSDGNDSDDDGYSWDGEDTANCESVTVDSSPTVPEMSETYNHNSCVVNDSTNHNDHNSDQTQNLVQEASMLSSNVDDLHAARMLQSPIPPPDSSLDTMPTHDATNSNVEVPGSMDGSQIDMSLYQPVSISAKVGVSKLSKSSSSDRTDSSDPEGMVSNADLPGDQEVVKLSKTTVAGESSKIANLSIPITSIPSGHGKASKMESKPRKTPSHVVPTSSLKKGHSSSKSESKPRNNSIGLRPKSATRVSSTPTVDISLSATAGKTMKPKHQPVETTQKSEIQGAKKHTTTRMFNSTGQNKKSSSPSKGKQPSSSTLSKTHASGKFIAKKSIKSENSARKRPLSAKPTVPASSSAVRASSRPARPKSAKSPLRSVKVNANSTMVSTKQKIQSSTVASETRMSNSAEYASDLHSHREYSRTVAKDDREHISNSDTQEKHIVSSSNILDVGGSGSGAQLQDVLEGLVTVAKELKAERFDRQQASSSHQSLESRLSSLERNVSEIVQNLATSKSATILQPSQTLPSDEYETHSNSGRMTGLQSYSTFSSSSINNSNSIVPKSAMFHVINFQPVMEAPHSWGAPRETGMHGRGNGTRSSAGSANALRPRLRKSNKYSLNGTPGMLPGQVN